MHRTRISLEMEQHRKLEEEARRMGISMSALIRKLMDAHFEAPPARQEDPLESIIGIGSGTGEPVGLRHDRYLHDRDARRKGSSSTPARGTPSSMPRTLTTAELSNVCASTAIV